jgi:hypothetical protein
MSTYDLPAKTECTYHQNTTRWSGGMALGPAEKARPMETQPKQTQDFAVTAGARRSSFIAYRMRYRRSLGGCRIMMGSTDARERASPGVSSPLARRNA